jgi:hypothetical protein
LISVFIFDRIAYPVKRHKDNMSHTTKRKSAMKNVDILKKAVARIPGAEYQGIGRANRYGGSANTGHMVKLPGWSYPVTIDLQTGECTYDNYNGHWGKNEHLDALNQGYAVEAAKSVAEAEHREMEEIRLDNGDIKLVVSLGGGGYGTDPEGGATEGGYSA